MGERGESGGKEGGGEGGKGCRGSERARERERERERVNVYIKFRLFTQNSRKFCQHWRTNNSHVFLYNYYLRNHFLCQISTVAQNYLQMTFTIKLTVIDTCVQWQCVVYIIAQFCIHKTCTTHVNASSKHQDLFTYN